MKEKNKISAVIITYNEGKNIEKCLKSLKNVADEIVVLDSFSDDNTEKICRKYGVRFLKHEFDGHIEQKNRARIEAKFPYVLSLDADEVLSPKLTESIKKVKESNKPADAYTFNRLNNYCGKWIRYCGWYPDKKLRLWKNSKARWGGVNPHDKVITVPDAKIEHLKGDLLHYTFTGIEQHIAQINKFSSIKAAGLFKQKKRAGLPKAYFKALAKFFISYFLKLGFLDGYYGYIICRLSAQSDFLKYIKLNELHKKEKQLDE